MEFGFGTRQKMRPLLPCFHLDSWAAPNRYLILKAVMTEHTPDLTLGGGKEPRGVHSVMRARDDT